jgi:DNA-binding transcriptional regulator YdaS (Cro superfamily)
MDMKTFIRQATPEQREHLAKRVGSSVAYFYQIAGGHKKAGPKLCQKLVAAEPRLTLSELRPDIWPSELTRRTRRQEKVS